MQKDKQHGGIIKKKLEPFQKKITAVNNWLRLRPRKLEAKAHFKEGGRAANYFFYLYHQLLLNVSNRLVNNTSFIDFVPIVGFLFIFLTFTGGG